jgi:hypothetical protein
MTTTVPATTMVIAPIRTCSDERQALTARPICSRSTRCARRRARPVRRRTPRRMRRSCSEPADGSAGAAGGASEPPRGGAVRVTVPL